MIRGAITISILALASARAEAPTAGQCLKLVAAVPYGAILTRSAVEAAPCPAPAPAGAVRFDSTAGLARAARNLAAGELIPTLPAFALAEIDRGQKLVIESRSGPVLVRRTVEAVQASKPAPSIFVRDSQGQVFAIPYPGRAP